MNSRWYTPAWMLVGLLTAVLTLASCNRPAGPEAADGAGTAYLLPAEPPGAQSVLETRAELESREKPGEAIGVVLVARIGGVEGLTWDPDRAAFVVRDLSSVEDHEPDEAPQHDADNCPFCRAKKKKLLASTALVQVVDAEGNVPPVDARKLLGLKEGRTIVVRGEAQIDGLGNLAVRAFGIYVRPEAAETAS